MIRRSLCVLLVIGFLPVGSPAPAFAEGNIKKLVLSDCGSALEQLDQLSEEEQGDLVEYLDRVISLETPSQVEAPVIELHPGSGALSGEDFLRSVRPSRDLDAKICAVKIASRIAAQSLRLIPALLPLQDDPLISAESRTEIRETVRKIATEAAAKPAAPGEALLIQRIGGLLDSRSQLNVESILTEFRERSQPVLSEFLKSGDSLKRSSAEHSIRLIDPSGKFAAATVDGVYDSVPQSAQERLLAFAGSFETSPAILRMALRANGQGELSTEALLILRRASDNTIDALVKDPAGSEALTKFILSGSFKDYREVASIICRHGRCDALLGAIAARKDLTDDLRLRALTILAVGDSFDDQLWQFARTELQATPARKAVALEALGAFSAKKTETLDLTAKIADKARDAEQRVSRPLLIRSFARLIVRLAPIPARYLQEPLGTELLGLEVTTSEPFLAANAVSAFRPPPVKLFLSAIQSKAESIRRQGLAAIAQTKPIDNAIVDQLLLLSAEETGDQPASDLTAEGTLDVLAEQVIPQLQKALKKQKKIALVAAEMILKRRPSDRLAAGKIIDAFSGEDCPTKLRWYGLIREQAPAKRGELWACRESLIASAAQRQSFLHGLSPLTPDEWAALLAALPADVAQANQYLEDYVEQGAPPDLLAPILQKAFEQHAPLEETLRLLRFARSLIGKPEAIVAAVQKIWDAAPSNGAASTTQLRAAAAATLYHLDPENGLRALLEVLRDPASVRLLPEYLQPAEMLPVAEAASNQDIKFGTLWPILCKIGEAGAKFELLAAKADPADQAIALACIAPKSPQLPKLLHALSLLPDWKHFADAPLPATFAPVLIEDAAQVPSYFERALYLELARGLKR